MGEIKLKPVQYFTVNGAFTLKSTVESDVKTCAKAFEEWLHNQKGFVSSFRVDYNNPKDRE